MALALPRAYISVKECCKELQGFCAIATRYLWLSIFIVKLSPSRILGLILAASIPTVLVANRAEAMCRCRVVTTNNGVMWLCCDRNGMCAYYDQPNYMC